MRRKKSCGGGPMNLRTSRHDENDRAARISDQLKPPEILRGRHDQQPERNQAAEPDNQRGQRHVPYREHRVIIIAGLLATTLDWLTDRILDALARGERRRPASAAVSAAPFLRRGARPGRAARRRVRPRARPAGPA